jgi:cardiolipin synthase
LRARRSPAASISWIWANLALPIVGVPLYWFLRPVRVKDYKRDGEELLADIPALRSDEGQSGGRPPSHLHHYNKIFSVFGKVFYPVQSWVELLVDGSFTFQEIFRGIQQAQSYILVQYYILRSDRLGKELKDLLINKAREGIKIYLLYDDMGSFWLPRKYLADLKKAGVATAPFLPIFSIKRFFLLNYRNHRKLVIVDGTLAFTGGLNVGEEYVGSRYGKNLQWRDTHIQIKGDSVKQLESIFYNDWHYATGIDLATVGLQPRVVADLPSMATSAKNEASPAQEMHGTSLSTLPPAGRRTSQNYLYQWVQIFPSGPFDETNIGMLLFMQMIHGAQRRIWVSTPYFIPDEALQKSLELAVLRGIDVRILIPEKSEERVVHWVTISYAEQVQSTGVKILLYNKGFNHQKVVLIDDDLTFIGTSNFDNRAMYLNFETMVAIFGRKCNQQVEKMLEDDFIESTPFKGRSKHRLRKLLHLGESGARLLAPLL